MRESFDVVVVGARCAGAPLATFLARAGLRVLVVDKDPLPSDQVLSTHTIHPPGMAVLDELGVGDAVRSGMPPSRVLRLRKGDSWADISYLDGGVGGCPRRERLDGLLQDAAVEAGVELRDRTRVTRVLFEEGRAVGVTLRHGAGDESTGAAADGAEGPRRQSEDVRANLVVGADGRRSLVAEEVGAEEYLAYEAPRAMYWAYWDAPDPWWTDRYPFDLYLGHVGDYVRVIFQTDDEQLLVGCLPPVDEARSWSSDPESALCENLAQDSVVGSLLDGASPDSSVRGTLKERYFFREAAGRGWVLVGDAGHHKDFVIGDGITEALLQAKSLAEAIVDAGGPADADEALVRWWRHRDVEALPLYFWGKEDGALDPPTELEALILRKVSRDEELRRRMARLPEHLASPYDALPLGAVLPMLLGALLRGRFGVLPEFLAFGRRATEYERVMEERRELLDEAASSPDNPDA